MINEHELEVMKTLPRPPKRPHLASDEELVDWLKGCADVSSEGIRTAFQAHVWCRVLLIRVTTES
jgi:hypothetical protein